MANTRLLRTLGTPTNGMKFTWSAWVKRGNLDSDQVLFNANNAGSTNTTFRFNSNNKLYFFYLHSSSMVWQYETDAVFRDTFGWMHIVFAYDSTLSNVSERVKIYVNGSRITGFSQSTHSSQNVTNSMNSAVAHYIGDNGGSNAFDGLMSHVHFVDGTAYQASDFGLTDSVTGEWTINTAPSVNYGNNGFFILKDGNSLTDQSPNSNDWTVDNGTLTKTEDNPSNVFSNLISVYQSNPTGGFANSLTTAKTGNGDSTWRSCFSSIAAPPSGKYYMELKWVSGSHLELGALSTQTMCKNNFKDWVDTYTGEYMCLYGSNWYNKQSSQGTYQSGVTLSTGVIAMMALDRDNNKLWWGVNGSWGGSQNPATNTGGQSLPGHLDDFWHLGASVYSNSGHGVFEFNFGNGYFGTTAVSSAGTNASGIGIFEYDVPSGFTALSTKGLNE